MSETNSSTFHRPTTPAAAGPEAALQVLNDATADGISIPHMTILWADSEGVEISMTTLTADEFTAWATWLNVAGRPSPTGASTSASGTRNGVRVHLATRAAQVVA